MKLVLMTGGLGSKLWPYSRIKAPKQFVNIIGEKTLFQMTVDQLLQKYTVDDIFVSVTDDLVHYVEEQAPQLKRENYIIEPMMRDTGPASCLAMAKVAERYPDEVVYFYVQVVCVREPGEKYLEMIELMDRLVREEGKWVTGTMIPKYAETGSDLMKLKPKKVSGTDIEVFEVEEFINVVKERMTLEQVVELEANNTVGTHNNHYTWRPKEFFEAVRKYRPDWYEIVEEIRGVLGKSNEAELMKNIYAKFVPNRIEVLTTELIREGKLIAIKLPFEWSHITTWDDVYRYRQSHNMPTSVGEVLEVDSRDNLVISQSNKLVTLIGMEEIVVVDTGEGLLIMPRSMGGRIKEANDKMATEDKWKRFQ